MGKAGKKKRKPKSRAPAADDLPKEALLDEAGAATTKFKLCLVEIFGRFDVDKDRLLSPAELKAFSAAVNEEGTEWTDEELLEMRDTFHWDAADGQNGAGGLTLRGWLEMYVRQTSVQEEETWSDLCRLGYDNSLELPPAPGAPMKSRNEELRARLEQLVALGESGELEAFVAAFVTPDVGPDDRQYFLENLRGTAKEPGQMPGLLVELRCCATGNGVFKIEGDKETKAGPVIFHFRAQEKGLERIDREVAFVKVDGQWHAEG